ncbi:MAG: DUF3791 domain-containing protein [Firmicutes bacterium]|nr:DUF3791 domain-containing protein [Bacillota bacterium]
MREINRDELEFAVFCVESVAEALRTTGDRVYKMMADDTDVLDEYVIPFYDALHTQGKEYIVRELLEVLRSKGANV